MQRTIPWIKLFVLKCLRISSFLIIAILILAQCTKKTSAQYVQDGHNLTKNERYDEAFEAYKMAIEQNPKNPDAHYGLGGIYNQKENYLYAEKAFSTALKLDPTYLDAYYSLGYTYQKMGKIDKAQKYIDQYKTLKKKITHLIEKEKAKS